MLTIPKKLHRVWAGDDPIPDSLEDFWNQWKELHPEWEFFTWRGTEEAWDNQELLEKQVNVAARSDILRLEVVYRHGGVYVDTDVQPFKEITPLIEHHDCFVVGVEAGKENAMFGSVEHHPLWKKAIDILKTCKKEAIPTSRILPTTGPDLITHVCKNESVHSIERRVLLANPHLMDSPDTYSVHWNTGRWSDKPDNFFESKGCHSGRHCGVCRSRELDGFIFRKRISSSFKTPSVHNFSCPFGKP